MTIIKQKSIAMEGLGSLAVGDAFEVYVVEREKINNTGTSASATEAPRTLLDKV